MRQPTSVWLCVCADKNLPRSMVAFYADSWPVSNGNHKM